MTTTIQIDDATKEDLFRIKLKLEEHKGKPVTYNELIQYLIEGHSSNLIRKKSMLEFRKLQGTISQETVDAYNQEKRRDLQKEEDLVPLNE